MSSSMKILIVVPVAVFVPVRLWLRRRRRPGGVRAVRAGFGLSILGGDTALVASREVRERLRTRAFRVVTLLLLLVAAAAIIVPVLTGGRSRPQRLGVVGTLSGAQRAAVLAAARSIGTRAAFVTESGAAAAEADLRSGRIDLTVIDGRRVLADKAVPPTDTTATARLAYVMAANLGLEDAFTSANLTPAQAARISEATPLPVNSLQPASPRAGAAPGRPSWSRKPHAADRHPWPD